MVPTWEQIGCYLISKVDGSLEKEIYLWDFPPSSLEFDFSEYALAEQAKC